MTIKYDKAKAGDNVAVIFGSPDAIEMLGTPENGRSGIEATAGQYNVNLDALAYKDKAKKFTAFKYDKYGNIEKIAEGDVTNNVNEVKPNANTNPK